MRLFGYWRSSSSWRVRIALAHKALAFEYVAIGLLDGIQHSSEHRARSPMGKVPVLELDDGRLLSESMAIIAYLDEVYLEPPLLPRDPYLRARARMLAEMVNSGIQPFQNLNVLRHVRDGLGQDEKSWARRWIGDGLAALETAVAATAGTFCVGDSPTLADLFVVPQLYSARRFGVDIPPRLAQIDTACTALPSFVTAHPDRQPDAPVLNQSA